jgi:hypothetical protein
VAAIGLFMLVGPCDGCRATPLATVVRAVRHAFDTAKPPFLR